MAGTFASQESMPVRQTNQRVAGLNIMWLLADLMVTDLSFSRYWWGYNPWAFQMNQLSGNCPQWNIDLGFRALSGWLPQGEKQRLLWKTLKIWDHRDFQFYNLPWASGHPVVPFSKHKNINKNTGNKNLISLAYIFKVYKTSSYALCSLKLAMVLWEVVVLFSFFQMKKFKVSKL